MYRLKSNAINRTPIWELIAINPYIQKVLLLVIPYGKFTSPIIFEQYHHS